MSSWSKENLKQIVSESFSKTECLKKMGLNVKSGGNFRTLNRKIEKYGLNTEHFDPYRHLTDHSFSPRSLNDILKKGSHYKNTRLKERLIEKNMLRERCSFCGLQNWWNGNPLTLQLDHINGNSTDNRLENLRLLCPNCHSQTDTYGGKNNQSDSNLCLDCGDSIHRTSTRCRSCAAKERSTTKIDWPTATELARRVKQSNYSHVARELKVSDTAVRKRLKNHFSGPLP